MAQASPWGQRIELSATNSYRIYSVKTDYAVSWINWEEFDCSISTLYQKQYK